MCMAMKFPRLRFGFVQSVAAISDSLSETRGLLRNVFAGMSTPNFARVHFVYKKL